jgi:hypothetical protein
MVSPAPRTLARRARPERARRSGLSQVAGPTRADRQRCDLSGCTSVLRRSRRSSNRQQRRERGN